MAISIGEPQSRYLLSSLPLESSTRKVTFTDGTAPVSNPANEATQT